MNTRLSLVWLLGLLVVLVASTTAFSQVPNASTNPPSSVSAQPAGSDGGYRRGPIVVDNAQVVSAHKIQVAAQADGIIAQLMSDE